MRDCKRVLGEPLPTQYFTVLGSTAQLTYDTAVKYAHAMARKLRRAQSVINGAGDVLLTVEYDRSQRTVQGILERHMGEL